MGNQKIKQNIGIAKASLCAAKASLCTTFCFRSVAEAYEHLIPYILEHGYTSQSERGLTKFLPYTLIEITNPKLKRIPSTYPLGKKAVNDYVQQFLYGSENTFKYTYHERVFRYSSKEYTPKGYNDVVNQVDYVIDKLSDNPNTRRAVITVWNPLIDTKSEDVPCLTLIHFQIINNALYMQTVMRSQDALLAFPSNLLAFIELGEMVARHVNQRSCSQQSCSQHSNCNLQLKRLIHYVFNLHIYVERDKDYLTKWGVRYD